MNKRYHAPSKTDIMPAMHRPSPQPRTMWSLLSLLALSILVVPGLSGTAGAKGKGKPKYYFDLIEVKLKEGIPAPLAAQVEAEVRKSFTTADAILPALDAATFKKYLKKKKLSAFRVNVEVTSYEQQLEPLPEGRGKGQRLTTSIAVRMFGETMPDRVMAFTGEGSAKVKIEIGTKLRPVDESAANHDAIELAVSDALAQSLTQLGKPKDTPKK